MELNFEISQQTHYQANPWGKKSDAFEELFFKFHDVLL